MDINYIYSGYCRIYCKHFYNDPFRGYASILCIANSDNDILVSHRRTVCRGKLEADTGNSDKQQQRPRFAIDVFMAILDTNRRYQKYVLGRLITNVFCICAIIFVRRYSQIV